MYKVRADKQQHKPVENAKELRRLLTLLLRSGAKEIKITKI